MPVAITGDMIKVFQHQQVPGIDDIYYPGRSLVSYKIVTSAAFDYDRPECIAETFAAYRTMTPAIALRTILDQAAMGINMQMDARRSGIDPAIDPLVGRLDYLLRGGRHVADVGVRLPDRGACRPRTTSPSPRPAAGAATPGFTYSVEGGVLPPEIDYQEDGELLYRSLPARLHVPSSRGPGRNLPGRGPEARPRKYRQPGGVPGARPSRRRHALGGRRQQAPRILPGRRLDRRDEPIARGIRRSSGRDREVRDAMRKSSGCRATTR